MSMIRCLKPLVLSCTICLCLVIAPDLLAQDCAEELMRAARAYDINGHSDSSVVLKERAIAILENAPTCPDSLLDRAYWALGLYYVEFGDYAMSARYLRRTIEVCQARLGSNDPELAKRLHALANVNFWGGRLVEAERLYYQALEIRRSNFGENDLYVAANHGNLANVAFVRADYERAELLYRRALEICESTPIPDQRETSRPLRGLTKIYLLQERYEEAEPLILRSLEGTRGVLEQNSRPYTRDLVQLAEIMLGVGQLDSAETVMLSAIEIRMRTVGASHPELPAYYRQLADIYSKGSRWPEAESAYNYAIDVLDEHGLQHHPELAVCYERLSQMYRNSNQSAKALLSAKSAFEVRQASFAASVDILPERQAIEFASLLRASADDLLDVTIDATVSAKSDSMYLCDALVSTKGIVTDILKGRRKYASEDVSRKDESDLRTLQALKSRIAREFTRSSGNGNELSYQLDTLLRKAAEIEGKLLRSTDAPPALSTNLAVNTDSIRRHLAPNCALIEYYRVGTSHSSHIDDGRYVAVRILHDSEPNLLDLGPSSEINLLVSRYRAHMESISDQFDPPNKSDLQLHKSLAQELYQRLWEPIGEELQATELVLVSPDGDLNLLPFAALMDEAGKYLVEKYSLHYVTAGRDILRPRPVDAESAGMVAFADPDFNATVRPLFAMSEDQWSPETLRSFGSDCEPLADRVLSSLPATRTEAERVTSTWRQTPGESTALFLGENASEAKFKSTAPGYSVIYIATHGYYLPDTCNQADAHQTSVYSSLHFRSNPLLHSGLFMAGANRSAPDEIVQADEDGILTAYEVASLDLTGADLVVLSACESGLGGLRAGEGVFGLRRGFLMAGARQVISSLWRVKDSETQQLMSRLFSNTDQPVYSMLRSSQLARLADLRSQGIPDHPVLWAAFISIGAID